MAAKRGKIVMTDELNLPSEYIMDILTSYKYLSNPQSYSNHAEEEGKPQHLKAIKR